MSALSPQCVTTPQDLLDDTLPASPIAALPAEAAAAAEVGAGCVAPAQVDGQLVGGGAEDDRPNPALAPVADVEGGDQQAGRCAPLRHRDHNCWLL